MARRGSGYRIAVLCSTLLHGALLYLLISGWHPEFHPPPLPQQNYIEASLLQMERPAQQAARAAPAKPAPEPPAPEPPKAEPTPEPPKPEPPKPDMAEVRRAEQAAQQKAAQEKQAQETAAREKLAQQKAALEKAAAEKAVQEKALAKKAAEEKAAKDKVAKEQAEKAAKDKVAREKAAQEKAAREKAEQAARALREQQEAAQRAAAQAQAAAEQSVATFGDYVRDRVADNWSRPPSARRDMQVELQIQIVPTGQVMGVVVTRSSGDAAFDQSAVSAVQRAGRFERLQELAHKDPLSFEQYFRRFKLVFRPEDLRL